MTERTLVVACGALVKEIRAVLGQLGVTDQVEVVYLPANLHNRPERIAPEVDRVLAERSEGVDHMIVGYADCGTGGALDQVLQTHSATRLGGSHCYEFFAGTPVFEALHAEELGTFFLTDFLAKHFEQLIIVGLGIDRHPQLRDMYFGNYKRLVLLSQTEDAVILAAGRAAADRLGLAFEHRPTGLGPFRDQLSTLLSIRPRPR